MVKSIKKDKGNIIFKITKVCSHYIFGFVSRFPKRNFIYVLIYSFFQPSSIKSLSCLEDFVLVCKQEDELKAVIQSKFI